MITARPKESEPAPRVQSVDRAMRILFAVAQSKDGLKAAEVVASTGLPRQACYHLLHTLVATGILTRSGPGKYVLGLRVGMLIEGFKRQLAPPEHLAPVVRKIAEETGETAYASGWWDGEIVTLVTARGTSSVQAIEVSHGTYFDAHARASGKLLLAYSSEQVRTDYLSSHRLSPRLARPSPPCRSSMRSSSGSRPRAMRPISRNSRPASAASRWGSAAGRSPSRSPCRRRPTGSSRCSRPISRS